MSEKMLHCISEMSVTRFSVTIISISMIYDLFATVLLLRSTKRNREAILFFHLFFYNQLFECVKIYIYVQNDLNAVIFSSSLSPRARIILSVTVWVLYRKKKNKPV
jgi:hypothetical protein